MTNFYLGQITCYGFNFAPRGFAQCNGQILPLAQNTALFSLLGTTYGGNGQSTFGLPDLRGRTPLHFGNGNGSTYSLGEMAGTENVTLLLSEIPVHKHSVQVVSTAGGAQATSQHYFAEAQTGSVSAPVATFAYAAGQPNTMMNAQSLSLYGGNQPHNNMQPTLTVEFCIATTGFYPARN